MGTYSRLSSGKYVGDKKLERVAPLTRGTVNAPTLNTYSGSTGTGLLDQALHTGTAREEQDAPSFSSPVEAHKAGVYRTGMREANQTSVGTGSKTLTSWIPGAFKAIADSTKASKELAEKMETPHLHGATASSRNRKQNISGTAESAASVGKADTSEGVPFLARLFDAPFEAAEAVDKAWSGSTIGKTIDAGAAQFNAQVASTLAIPDKIAASLGADPGKLPMLQFEQQAKGAAADWARKRDEAVAGKGEAAQVLAQLGSGAAAAVPTAILAIMTGGGPAVTQLSPQATGIADTVAAGVQSMAKNPQYWTSFLQTVGTEYDDAVDSGADAGTAVLTALTAGLINSAVEIGGGIETLPQELRKGGGHALREWFKSGLDEGKEEIIQGIVSGLTQKAMVDPSKPLSAVNDESAAINLAGLAREGAMGAGVGWLLGGGQVLEQAAGAAINKAQEGKRNKTVGQALAEMNDGKGYVQGLIQEGLSQPEGSRANQLAGKMQQKIQNGGTVSDFETGRLYGAIADQREAAPQPKAAEAQQGEPSAAEAQQGEVDVKQRNRENRAEMRGISRVLGKNGRTLVTEFYDGTERPDSYYQGFAAFYQAGMAGADVDGVQSPYASMLTERQQGMAYQAGRQDAKVSLKQESKNNDPQGWGRKAGLYGSSEQLSQEQAARLEDVAKRTGTRIEIVEGMGQDGLYDPETGTIRISKDAKNPILEVAAHELSHRIQDLAPEQWREYRDYAVRQLLQQSGEALDTSAAVDRKIGEYREQGINLDTEEAMDELAAEYTRKLLEGEDLFKSLAENKPSLARRVLDALKAFLQKLRGKDQAQQNQQAREAWGADAEVLQEAARRWESALQKATERAGEVGNTMTNALLGEQEGEKARYSIVTLDDGERITVIDRDQDIFKGQPVSRYSAIARKYLIEHFKGQVLPLGAEDLARITKNMPGEYAYPAKRHELNAIEYEGKMRAATELENLLETAEYVRWENDHKNHPEATLGFDYYKTKFAVGGHLFEGLINIANSENGRVLYDITKINEIPGTSGKYVSLMDRSSSASGNLNNKVSHQGNDVKYSTGKNSSDSLESLARENKRLREQVDYLKGQTKTSVPGTVRQDAVKATAKALLKEYSSTVPVQEITADLSALYNLMGTGEQDGVELTYETARELADKVSRKIVENALERNDETYRQYEDLRKLVRGTKLLVTEQMMKDLEHLGGWNEFRKRNMGRLLLSSKEGTAVDSFFQELGMEYGEFFDENQGSNPADQLIQIADAMDAIYTIQEYNPFSRNMDEAAAVLTNDILDRFWDIPEMKTFADVQRAKQEEIRARGAQEKQQAVSEVMARETQRRKDQVQRVHEHYSDIQKQQLMARDANEVRNSLLKTAQRLERMKTTEANRERIGALLGDLDTVARKMTGKKELELKNLRDWYREQLDTNPYFIPDPKTEQALERLEKKGIDELSLEEARDLLDAMRNLENELRTSKKLLDSQDRRDVYQMGEQIIDDIENSNGSKGGVLDKYIVSGSLSPVRMARRITGYVDSDPLYLAVRSLQEGETAAKAYQMRAERPFQRWAQDKAFSKSFSGKDAQAITMKGWSRGKMVDVTITPAMRASIYLHSLNPQNLRHMVQGGVTIPDWKLYQKGELSEAYKRGVTVKLTVPDVRAIANQMTQQEREFARAANYYFNQVSKPAINGVSEKLKGYSIAKVGNYFPINTDRSFTKADFESLKFDGTLEGMGFLKERKQGAVAPLMLRDVDSVLQQSIQQHGKYVGMAIPVRNMNKLLGVTSGSFNEDGSRNGFEGSVQKAIGQKWGGAGLDYIEKMMTDVQMKKKENSNWGRLFDKVRGKYAGAALNMNAGVAMKQAASYPTAAAVLGWEPLAKAMKSFGSVDLSLIERYTPLQWYRTQGYSTQELGDMTSRGKQLPKGLNWIQGADLLTTRKLWKASEYYVQKYSKELTRGSDAYYQEVARVYNQVIQETQPSYSTMDRPDILRSENALVKNVMMFKTQPLQNFNTLYDAAENFMAKRRQERAGTAEAGAVEEAGRRFAWAVTSQVAQVAVFAAMTAAWNALRGKDKKYRDEDGEWSWAQLLKSMGLDALSGVASMVPMGSEAVDLAGSLISGGNYYGMDAASVSAVSDSLQALVNLSGAVQKLWSDDPPSWKSTAHSVDSAVDYLSKAAGIPYENVMNLMTAATDKVLRLAEGQYLGKYDSMKLTVDPEKKPAEYYGLLFQAMKKDSAAYRELYQRMIGDGWEESKIKSQMENRMKAAQGVEKAEDLEKRWMPPEQDAKYDASLQKMEGSSVWRSASDEQRQKARGLLYDLTVGNKDGEKIREAIDGGKGAGVTDEDYLLFKLALNVVDQPSDSGKLGTYTNQETQEALLLLDAGDQAKGYLWGIQNASSSEERNPYTGELAENGVDAERILALTKRYNELMKEEEDTRKRATEFSKYVEQMELTKRQQELVDQYYHYSYQMSAKPLAYSYDTMSSNQKAAWDNGGKAAFRGDVEAFTGKYYEIEPALKEISGLKDKDGKTIANSAGLLKMEAIYQVPGLSKAQREAMFEAFGVGVKVRGYSKQEVERALKEMRRKGD